jgi:acyl-CoA synthetase (AMP-forming)/AMP-acid ligase II
MAGNLDPGGFKLPSGDQVGNRLDLFPSSEPMGLLRLLTADPDKVAILYSDSTAGSSNGSGSQELSYRDLKAALSGLPSSIVSLLPGHLRPHALSDSGIRGLRVLHRSGKPEVSALLTLSLLESACCVPCSPEATWTEVLNEAKESGCGVVILGSGSAAGEDALEGIPDGQKWTESGVFLVCSAGLKRDENGTLSISLETAWRADSETRTSVDSAAIPRGHIFPSTFSTDTVLILRTSGSTGAKKIVPYTLRSVVIGALLCGESWGLTEKDRCVNVMPVSELSEL